MSEEIAAHLEEAGVAVKPYSAVAEDIKAIAAAGTKLWMDPAKVRHQLPVSLTTCFPNHLFP